MVDVTKKADLDLIDTGGWQTLKNFRPARILTTSFDTPACRKLRTELHMELFGEELSADDITDLDDGVINYITARLLMDACVRNWEGFDEGKAALPYSREALRKLLFKEGHVLGGGYRSIDGWTYNPQAKYLFEDLRDAAVKQGKDARAAALQEKKPQKIGSGASAVSHGTKPKTSDKPKTDTQPTAG